MASKEQRKAAVITLRKPFLNIPVGSEFNVQKSVVKNVRGLLSLKPVNKEVNGGFAIPIEVGALKTLISQGTFEIKE